MKRAEQILLAVHDFRNGAVGGQADVDILMDGMLPVDQGFHRHPTATLEPGNVTWRLRLAWQGGPWHPWQDMACRIRVTSCERGYSLRWIRGQGPPRVVRDWIEGKIHAALSREV